MDVSRIFPSTSADDDDFVGTSRRQLKRPSSANSTPFQVKRRPWGSSLKCSLSLASDGSFVLVPRAKNAGRGRASVVESATLPIRGQWSVVANPYCITDRFYDNVSLVSYPRERVVVTNSAVGRGSSHSDILQTFELNLYCRLWGRHTQQHGTALLRRADGTSPRRLQRHQQHQQQPRTIQAEDTTPAGSAAFSTEPGRMTHGSLVWKELFPPSSPWWRRMKPRPVLASFSARRRSREPFHEGWFDREYYGY